MGFNQILLQNPIGVQKGQMILLTQLTTLIAIDTKGNSSCSDLILTQNIWSKLNKNSNWRLYFTTITNFFSYQSNFGLTHYYSKIGLYYLSITFLSSNITFNKQINVTDCKNKIKNL